MVNSFISGQLFYQILSEIDISKKNMASLIASAQNQHPGHKLRHAVVESYSEI